MASVALSIKNLHLPKISRAFYYMLGVSFLRAAFIIIEKYILEREGNWVNLVIYTNLISGLLPLLLLLKAKGRKDIAKHFKPYMKSLKFFAVNEFFCFLGMCCSIYALSGISPVVSSSIDSTLPIFMLLISYLLLKYCNLKLKEQVSTKMMIKKMYFFILMILGVILVIV